MARSDGFDWNLRREKRTTTTTNIKSLFFETNERKKKKRFNPHSTEVEVYWITIVLIWVWIQFEWFSCFQFPVFQFIWFHFIYRISQIIYLCIFYSPPAFASFVDVFSFFLFSVSIFMYTHPFLLSFFSSLWLRAAARATVRAKFLDIFIYIYIHINFTMAKLLLSFGWQCVQSKY